MCFASGAERKRLPRWRTIRVMTTTRRPGEREDRDRAARRPRPKVDRPVVPPVRPKALPVWPAFFAARITSPTKLFGRLAPWLPWRMRPGRRWMSSSRVLMAARALRTGGDGALSVEFLGLCGASASWTCWSNAQIIQPNQPHAPDNGRRFYLAVRWSCSPAPPVRHSNPRQGPPDHDEARSRSWPWIPPRRPDEQAVRLRRDGR